MIEPASRRKQVCYASQPGTVLADIPPLLCGGAPVLLRLVFSLPFLFSHVCTAHSDVRLVTQREKKQQHVGRRVWLFNPRTFTSRELFPPVNGSEELLLGACFRNPPENVKAEAFIIVNNVKLFFF